MNSKNIPEWRKLQISMRSKFTRYLKNRFNDNVHPEAHIGIHWQVSIIKDKAITKWFLK